MWRKGLLAAVLAASLAACTSVPLASLWQLRKFDFESFDPGELRLALRLPTNVALWPDGLRVEIKVTREATDAQVEESVWLRELAGGFVTTTADAGLPTTEGGPRPWVVLQLSARDGDRLLRLRQQLMATRAKVGQGKNRLEVKIDPQLCLRSGVLDAAASVSAAVRWQAQTGFVMLLNERSLRDVTASLGLQSASLPLCSAAPKLPQ